MADNVPELGKVIGADKNVFRDCVHVAVAPVVAANHLSPGERVGLLADGKAGVVGSDNAIGVVDPFLKHLLMPGDRFWLFLFPNTVSGMRHVWTHSAFRTQLPKKEQTDE